MRAPALFLLVALVAACARGEDSPRTDLGVGGDGGPVDCVTGERRCTGLSRELCEGGTWRVEATCAGACDTQLGCVSCAPGTGTCAGGVSHTCRADGSGYDDISCDPLLGLSCGASGLCEGACAPQLLGDSYFGCEYWPTVTGNSVANDFDFALAIANHGSAPAIVTIDGGTLAAAITVSVPAHGAVTQALPWVPELKLCNQLGGACLTAPAAGALVRHGAYHVRATAPVTVYQFNPLQYTNGTLNSSTNDASLLFPSTTWRTEHYAATWHHIFGSPSLVTVTAGHDGTLVTITASADAPGAGATPGFSAGIAKTVMLDAGDVIELASPGGDLTGTHVTSDAPVQVIAGHYCANVPDDKGACDHLEETMLGVEALGTTYVVNAPALPPGFPNGKSEIVRVLATQAGTTLSYDPPLAGAPTSIANAGEWIEVQTEQSFVLTATHKVLVAQLMEGNIAGTNGDPSLTLATPVEQFRNTYIFHAPPSYDLNSVDITAPMGASVLLDGAVVTGFTPIGASAWQLARKTDLDDGPLGDGNHTLSSTNPVSISVYGYGIDTSYWYPGGLDLHVVMTQ